MVGLSWWLMGFVILIFKISKRTFSHSAVGHWDSRINGSATVRGCHLDFHSDHQKYQQFVDNDMQGSYSGLSTCN